MASAPPVSREYSLTYGSIEIASIAAGTGVYTLDATQPTGWIVAGIKVAVFGCTNAANNGIFVVTSISGVTLTLVNAASVLEASTAGQVGFPVGGTSDFELHDHLTVPDKDYGQVAVSFMVVFAGVADDATFKLYETAIEKAFRVPSQRLRILVNAVVRHDYNPKTESGGNTGFLQSPSISQPGDTRDTARSRLFKVDIRIQMPADVPAKPGRREATYTINFDESRIRSITFSGSFTALDSNGAKAQYDAQIATWANGVLDSYGGNANYELLKEDVTPDDYDKICQFSREYREVIFNQSSAGLNHAAIQNPTFDFSKAEVAPGDSDSTARRLIEVTCVFDCAIDRDSSTDPEGLWSGTVRPYIISKAQSLFSLGQVAVVARTPTARCAPNRLSGVVVMQAVSDSNLIEYTVTMQSVFKPGKVLVPTADGNPLAYHVIAGPAEELRITSETKLEAGGGGGGGGGSGSAPAAGATFGGLRTSFAGQQYGFDIGAGLNIFSSGNSGAAQSALVDAVMRDDFGQGGDGEASGAPPGGGESGWILIQHDVTTQPEYRGIPPDVIQLTRTTTMVVEQYVESPSGGGSGDVAT